MGIRKRSNVKRAKNCSMRLKKGNKKSQNKILRGPANEKWDIKKTLRENYQALGLELNADEQIKIVDNLKSSTDFGHSAIAPNRPTSVFSFQSKNFPRAESNLKKRSPWKPY